MLKIKVFKKILFSIFFPIIWIFKPQFRDFSTLSESSIKKRRIAVFIVLCFLHVITQLGAIEQLYNENPVTKNMDLQLVKILTFPMYPITEKIGWYDETGLSKLPYIDYIFMTLNAIFWVWLFFFIAGKIAVFRNRHYPLNAEQEEVKDTKEPLCQT